MSVSYKMEERYSYSLCTNKAINIMRSFEDYLDWYSDNNIPVGEFIDEKKDVE